MAQQTAVQWLVNQLKQQGFLYDLDIEGAKQMEKEQIINAFDIACEDEDRIGEEYYNDIFGGRVSPDTNTSQSL